MNASSWICYTHWPVFELSHLFANILCLLLNSLDSYGTFRSFEHNRYMRARSGYYPISFAFTPWHQMTSPNALTEFGWQFCSILRDMCINLLATPTFQICAYVVRILS